MATPKREARVVFRIVRANGTDRVLKGITADAQKATKAAQREQEKAQKATLRAAEKAAKDGVKATERAEKTKVREAKKTADQIIKEAKRTAAQELRIQEQTVRMRQRVVLGWMRQESREQAKAFRERERGEKRAAQIADRAQRTADKARKNATDRRESTITGMTGGLLASGVAALTLAVSKISSFNSGSRDRLGVARVEDKILDTKQVREDFTRSMTTAGMSGDQRKTAFDRLNKAAVAQGVMPEQLLNAANVAQETYSDPNFVINNADFIAQLARATGGDAGDLTRSMLTSKQKYGLNDAETVDVARRQYSQTGEGAIEFKALASAFAPTFAMFKDTFGEKGGGAQNAVLASAIAQTMGRALKSPDEAATLMERMLIGITDTGVQKKLGKHGINIADDKGNLNAPAEVFRELFSPENMPKLTPAVLQEVFGNILSVQGMQTFLTEMRGNPERFNRLTESTGATGQTNIDTVITALRELPTEQINEMQVNAASVALTSDGIIQLYIDGAKADIESETKAREAFGAAADVMDMKGFGGEFLAELGKNMGFMLFGDTNANATAGLAAGGTTLTADGKVSSAVLPGSGLSSSPGWLQDLARMIGVEVKNSTEITVKAADGTKVVGVETASNARTLPGVTNGRRGGG